VAVNYCWNGWILVYSGVAGGYGVAVKIIKDEFRQLSNKSSVDQVKRQSIGSLLRHFELESCCCVNVVVF
jgi:hypothetical protein